MPQLRVSPSGPLIVGDNDNDVLIWNAATREWEPGAQTPGGTLEPVQQVRYLDAEFAAASPNGSIAAPYIAASSFFGEVAAPGGWGLMLPAYAAGDFTIPDLGGVPVALIGVTSQASSIGSIPIAAQGASEPFPALQLTLRDLTTGTLTFNGGPLALVAEGCDLGTVEASGTVTGSARFINCSLRVCNFPDCAVDAQNCFVGSASGNPTTAVVGAGSRFRDCRFNALTLQLFGAIELFDCSFTGAIVLQCAASESITIDPVSYARLIAAAPTFPDTTPTFLPVPRLLHQQQIGLVNGAVLPAASIVQFNLGPPPANPPALPGGLAQVQFLGSPGSSVVCVGATISGGGDILVQVLNVSDTLTAEVVNDQAFVVFYEPGTSLA